MAITPLCSDADLEARYGATNIGIMADLDSDGSSVKKAARTLLARTRATARIYDRLRASGLGFVLPITTAPDTLVDITVKLSGYWLSTASGCTNYDKDGSPMTRYFAEYVEATRLLDDIATGKLKLDVDL